MPMIYDGFEGVETSSDLAKNGGKHWQGPVGI